MKQYLRPLSIALLALFLAVQSSYAEVGNDNPTGVTGEHNGSVTTAGSYDPYTGNAKRFIDDLSVTGAVGTYPLKWTRVLNSRGHGGPFGHGGGWSHSYAWGLWVRDMNQPYHYYPNPYEGPAGGITYPDGREVALESYDPHIYTPIASSAEPMDRLVYVEGSNGEYDLLLRDGGRVEFRHAAGTTGEYAFLYATTIVDPYGLKTTLERDSQGGLRITEPGGRFLQINYERKYGMTSDSYIDVISSVDVYADANTKVETVVYSYEPETVVSDGFYVKYWYLRHVFYDDATQAEYTYYPAGQATQEYRVKLPGCVESCRDVRFAGPMKNIRYEYLKRDQNYPEAAWGQITAEENLTTGQKISEIEYPVYNPYQAWDPGWRIEHRPDGATRRFDYSGAELASYTDFTYPGEPAHTSSIQYAVTPDGQNYYKTLTDARGKATRITKDGVTGAVLSIMHPGDGSTINHTYSDPNNAYYLTSKTDERATTPGDPQHTIFYDRDAKNRIWQVRYPDGAIERFIYDQGAPNGFNQVTDHLMTSGGTEHFRYDSRGRKTLYWPPPTESDPNSGPNPGQHHTQYFYYESGINTDRLRQVIDPRGNSTSYEYNERGQVTKVIHDQDGTFTQTAYNEDGTVKWTADENHPNAWMDGNENERTRYTYDEYKRVTSVTKPYAASAATNDYSPWNGRGKFSHTTASVYRAASATGKITDSDYDANFRRKIMTQAPGTSDAASTTYTYDEVGNLQTTRAPNQQPNGPQTVFEYDDRNRQFRVTDVFGNRTETAYDVANNKTSVTPADGHPIQFVEYDPMNRLKQQIDERNHPSYFEYFPGGNLKSHKDENGNVYSYSYDELNRKKTATYPPDSGGSVRTEHWTYDEAGNLKTFTNRSGAVQTFTLYDSRNRLIDFSWSDNTSGQHTEYDAASRVTWIVNNVSTIHQTYDDPNHSSTEEEWTSLFNDNNTHRAVTHTYNDDGNRLSLTYPSGASFNYEYTTKNQLKAIWPAGQGQPAVSYSYDLTGNVTGISRDNGTSTALTPDDANRITSVTHHLGQNVNPSFEYAYNDVNNLRAVRRDHSRGDAYDYDETREIKAFKREGVFSSWPGDINTITNENNNLGIVFDPAGNRISATNSNPNLANATYAVNGLNQYTGITETGGPSPTPTATIPPGVTPSPTATATATIPPGATPTATATATATHRHGDCNSYRDRHSGAAGSRANL